MTRPTCPLCFALRSLWREWRAGELYLLVAALLIAVGSLSTVGFFTDRIHRVMEEQAGELLAADLVVDSPDPISAEIEREAKQRSLASARTLEFPSMIMAGERLQLAEIKAVSNDYPLRGKLRMAPAPFAGDAPADAGPAKGEVWLDPRLITVLGLKRNDTVSVGEKGVRIGQVLSHEPDRGGNLFSIAPRLMMNIADIPATQLLQTGSRVRHRLLVAGEAEGIAGFRAWLKPRLKEGDRLQGLRDARPELRQALEQAERFLGLAALVSLVLAGAAVAVAARRYANRHLTPVAVMRCLGATQGLITRIFIIQLIIIGLVSGLAGSAIGFVAQGVLASMFETLLPGALPAPSPLPLIAGPLTGLATLIGFGLPPVLCLKDVSPARVLRLEQPPLPPRALSVYLSALSVVALLVYWQVGDGRLTAYVLGGTLVTGLLLALGAMLLIKGLTALRAGRRGTWRFGLAAIARRAGESRLQVVVFGLGLMALLLLTMVRGDLLRSWQHQLPPQAPNYFLINILPDDVSAVRKFLAARGISQAELYPMIRGRLSSINDRTVLPEDYQEPRAQRLASREFNLSWTRRLHPGNHVVSGEWWRPSEEHLPLYSVERGLARTLGIRLGDRLSFTVAGETVEARVSNLRAVQWDTFQVNFFVVSTPALLQPYPTTYITSFFLPEGREPLLAELVGRFTSITVLDVDALISRVRGLMERAALGVEYLFIFTLLAGFAVMAAAVQATLDERRYESAVVRTLGGSRRQVRQGLLAEFLALGALSGLLAAAGASAVGMMLADQLFRIEYRPDLLLWLTGVGGGMLMVGAGGLFWTRGVLDHPPLESLKN